MRRARAASRQRIVEQHGRDLAPEVGLDPADHDLGEDVRPAVVGGDAQAGAGGLARQDVAVRCQRIVEAGQQVDPGEAGAGLGDGDLLPGAEGIAGAIAVAIGGNPERGRHAAQQLLAVLDQLAIVARRPVPFEQGELRVVAGGALVVAPDPGEGEDPPLPGCQQLLQANSGEVWR